MTHLKTSLIFPLAACFAIAGAIFALPFIIVPRVPNSPVVISPAAQPREPASPPPPEPVPEAPAIVRLAPAGELLPIPVPPMPEIDDLTPRIRPPVKNPDARSSDTIAFATVSGDRVAAARVRSESTIRALFAQAGVKYPAHQIFLRGLKREGELELWAADRAAPWKLVATYTVAALSGRPGPKRTQGDRQVPEGFYEVDRFNPQSNFHLSLGLNYPNAADRILGHPTYPGADIFIHGNALSIGCLAMGDDRIEEIYLAAADSRARPIIVHLFPARMNASDWPQWRDEQCQGRPTLAAFWEDELRPAWDLFETEKALAKITIQKDGRYRTEARRR